MDRIDQGLEPACVAKCITKCLHFGEPSIKTRLIRDRYAKTIAELW
jgi:Fe-S-cluster-containing dehydrogenase component